MSPSREIRRYETYKGSNKFGTRLESMMRKGVPGLTRVWEVFGIFFATQLLIFFYVYTILLIYFIFLSFQVNFTQSLLRKMIETKQGF